MLSLVLLQSRSYGDIASLLRLGENDVRERAHAAAGQLVPGGGGLAADTRVRIIDYMLGEQTVSARAQTRSELQSSGDARRWAEQLAEGLAPLVKSPLPSIPDPPAHPPPAAERVKAATPSQPPVRPPAARFTPELPAPPRGPSDRDLPLRRLVVAASVAVVAIIALVIVLATEGGGSKHATTTNSTPPTTSTTATAPRAARTIEKLVLRPAGVNRNALGAGAVVQQKDGTLLLLVQARGLIPNSKQNAYAVWLVNSPGETNLLGFVKPAVGANGTFSSATQLPPGASRFHSLVVTIERSSQPTSPGPAVLRSPLSLP